MAPTVIGFSPNFTSGLFMWYCRFCIYKHACNFAQAAPSGKLQEERCWLGP